MSSLSEKQLKHLAQKYGLTLTMVNEFADDVMSAMFAPAVAQPQYVEPILPTQQGTIQMPSKDIPSLSMSFESEVGSARKTQNFEVDNPTGQTVKMLADKFFETLTPASYHQDIQKGTE